LEGLGKVINVLKNCGMTAIYVDGSFVTDKLEPGDWDACFDCSSDMSLRLFLSRYPLRDRELQKSLYKGELFPSWVFADNKGTKYIDFFQKLKITDVKKGILKMKLQDHDTE
jgi:hypothetical protein